MIVEGLSFNGLFGFDTYSSNTIRRFKQPDTYYIDPGASYDVDGSYSYNLTYEGNNRLEYRRYNEGKREYDLQTSLNYWNDLRDRHQISGILLYSKSDGQDNN